MEQPCPPVRARDLGVDFDGQPGILDAITDVPGLEVGSVTIQTGGTSATAARTGVTAILPRGAAGVGQPCAAGTAALNGNGELTGSTWIEESGTLATPILLTSSHAVGACSAGMLDWLNTRHPHITTRWVLPVVGETWDGYLSDINGRHVRPEHAGQALDSARSGTPAEGSVGGGTGMNCYGFKGGTGTASRVVDVNGVQRTVGVLLQANFGSRRELVIRGHQLGARSQVPSPIEQDDWLADDDERARAIPGAGSVIVVIATDAPLLPDQCRALARRAALGLARTGTTGSHFSGDIALAFSTANSDRFRSAMPERRAVETIEITPWGAIDPLFAGVVQAVEEAVVNALVAARDMTGRDGHYSPALPHSELQQAFG